MKRVLIIVLFLCVLQVSFTTELKVENAEKLLGILYHQNAAEYKALCFQAYNIAKERLLDIDFSELDKKPAIIVDVDETVLSNSRYNAREMLGIAEYPQGFYDWLDSMESQPVPGALEFLNYADSLGIEIYYITNRSYHAHEATVGNLQKFGFPQAVEDHVLCKEKESSKEPRRKSVSEDHEIILLIGDNLIDFADVFADRDFNDRDVAVNIYRAEFGRKFIILPNFMHGFWIKQLNDFRYDLTPEEKNELRMKYLRY